MATTYPNKRPKLTHNGAIKVDETKETSDDDESETVKVIIQFQTPTGETAGPQMEMPIKTSAKELRMLINQLLGNEEPLPYSFFVDQEEIIEHLLATIKANNMSTETVIPIVYQPQAIFRVRAVTRCSATIEGHSEAILHLHFSPDGQFLASGSGDATVRLWDLNTQTPYQTLKGHSNWVLATAWSPDATMLASGSMDKMIRLWDTKTGKTIGKPLKGHKKAVTCLAWQPFINTAEGKSPLLASGSQDGTCRIWDPVRKLCITSLSGHTGAINAIRWGGSGLLYTASHDRTIKVWDPQEGKLVRSLDGHAHRVNCLSLSTDHPLRVGPFDQKGGSGETEEKKQKGAMDKYNASLNVSGGTELLVSGSDDFTCFLWNPSVSKQPILRLTGHQQPVNYVAFSPDGRYIASASFDKSVRIWNGITGKYIGVLRGHVQSVYQVCWSSDSRLLVSSSKDSTIKVWDVRTLKLKHDLPGHADEVFACDWSPDGARVASGGRDKVLKIWHH